MVPASSLGMVLRTLCSNTTYFVKSRTSAAKADPSASVFGTAEAVPFRSRMFKKVAVIRTLNPATKTIHVASIKAGS
jgi:hypothetical protein